MKRILKISAFALVLILLLLASCGNTAWAGDGGTVPPPDLTFEVNGKYKVESGEFFSTTLTIKNETELTKTAVTTIAVGGPFVQQLIGYDAPGVITGTSSIWGASLNGAFMNLVWSVDVPANSSVSFTVLAQAIETEKQIAADGFLTWETGVDVIIKGISIIPVEKESVLRINTVEFNNNLICFNGQFDQEIDVVVLMFNGGSNVVNAVPVSQNGTQVCIDSSDWSAGNYIAWARTFDNKLSNGIKFVISYVSYLPNIFR